MRKRDTAPFESVLMAGSGNETVSHAVHCQEVPWHRGFRLEFLPQLDNVRVDRAGGRRGGKSPDVLQNHFARQDSIWILKEIQQQIVFGGRERDFVATIRNQAPLRVYFNGCEALHGSIGRAAP